MHRPFVFTVHALKQLCTDFAPLPPDTGLRPPREQTRRTRWSFRLGVQHKACQAVGLPEQNVHRKYTNEHVRPQQVKQIALENSVQRGESR